MRLDDTIELIRVTQAIDENLDPVEIKENISLGKCIITANESASVTTTNDGVEYIYSYLILMRKPRQKPIPKEKDLIHIQKKDGTIDKECRVKGFVTLRNWVKIWV